MHDIGRQPHTGVVVKPAGLVQLLDEAIHAGQARAALGHVGREVGAVGPGVMAGFELLLIAPDAVPLGLLLDDCFRRCPRGSGGRVPKFAMGNPSGKLEYVL